MYPRNPCDSTPGFSPSRTRGNWLHEHDKTKLSILEHQTWWERSSKERNARNKTTRQNEAQGTRTSNVVGEELKRKNRAKQKRHDKMKLSVLEHQTWWERSSKERNARNKTTRQNEAQRTRTSNVVGEELNKKETLETKTTRQNEAQRTRTSNVVEEELKKEKNEMSRGTEDQTFEPSWPNGEYLWISSETRKELISRRKDDYEILLIRIIRCRSIIRHARRPYDYDANLVIRIIRCRSIIRHARRPYDYHAILLIRIIRCRSIIRHAKQRKKTHTPGGGQKD